MARLRFTVGTRYLRNSQVFVVREILVEGRVMVENQNFGGRSVFSQEELCNAWAAGEIRFEVHGRYARNDALSPISTDYQLNNLQDVPEKQRNEAWRRFNLIRPLLALPSIERTRRAIEEYATSLIPAVEEQSSGPRKRSAVGAAMSARSIARWLYVYIESGEDIRSLIPATHKHGGKGQNRLSPDVERIVTAVLAESSVSTNRTTKDIYLMVVNRIADENRYRPQAEKLVPPGSATLYRRIQAMASSGLLRQPRRSRGRDDSRPILSGPSPTRILERVEIDHTVLDLFLVDEEDRLPIGRPTLTFALDVYSRYPIGCYVGFENPSYRAVQNCLFHAILPKQDTRKLYGTKNEWLAYGLPETLIIDNGKDFIGRDLDDACGQLGIILERMPVKMPWFKGSVERFFRTNNTGLIHTLPGTTFSNIIDRGDYDAFQHACVSLSAFWKLLHIFLLDVYTQDWHKGVEGIPAKRWIESVQNGFVPSLHNSAEEVRILLFSRDDRTLQPNGITFESLRYQSSDLARLRSRLSKGQEVKIKFDPGDLSRIYVLDPTDDGRWLTVPAIDTEYTRNLSLWKHIVIRRYVLEQKREVDIFALAEAKKRIQQVVDDEFRLTRTSRGRKTAARFLEIGTRPIPSTLSQTNEQSGSQLIAADELDAKVSSTAIPRNREKHGNTPEDSKATQKPSGSTQKRKISPTPSQTPDANQDLDLTGWGGDYELPHHTP